MGSIRVANFSKTLCKFLMRFSMMTLSKSNANCNWHVFTVSILEVLNNFIKNYLFQSLLILNLFWLMSKLVNNIAELVNIWF